MIHVGNCLDVLPTLPAESVQCCVTSPPYFGLRDYGVDGQHGLEPSVDAFVDTMVAVFREVRRVLRDDGTLWLNLGDSYAGAGGQSVQPGKLFKGRARQRDRVCISARITGDGLKAKDLVGIPWRVAFALQADGWYLRQDIIWHKPNPMPESVRDRCTKAHEYLFLLSKSPRYYFDAEAIAEPLSASSVARLSQPTLAQQAGSDRVPGKTNGTMKAVGPRFGGQKYGDDERPESRAKSGREWGGGRVGNAEQAQRLDGADPTVQGGALRDLPAGADRAVHSRRLAARRRGAGPIHGVRDDRTGGRSQRPALAWLRAEPRLRRHRRGPHPRHAVAAVDRGGRMTTASPSQKIGASKVAECVVADVFPIPRHICVPNVSWSLLPYEADLLAMTSSGYLIEVEIKVSLSDLKRDSGKTKWRLSCLATSVSRFYYAMPLWLWEKPSAKAAVRPGAGVIVVEQCKGRWRARIDVEAERTAAGPLTLRAQFKLARVGSFRAWSPHQKHRTRQLKAEHKLQERIREDKWREYLRSKGL